MNQEITYLLALLFYCAIALIVRAWWLKSERNDG